MVVYNGSSAKVFYTADGGNTWESFGTGVNLRDYTETYRKAKLWGVGTRKVVDFGEIGYHGAVGIDFMLDIENSNNWLKAVLGNAYTPVNGTTAGSGSVGGLSSIDVQYELGGKYWKLGGAKFDGLKISSATGELVTVSLDGMYKTRSAGSAVSGVNVSSGGLVSFGSSEFLLSGNSVGYVNRFEVDLKNNLVEVYALGDLHPSDIVEQKAEVSFNMETWIDDSNWLNLLDGFNSGNVYNFGIQFVSGTYTFKIDFGSDAVIERLSAPARDADMVKASISGYSKDLNISITSS